jgi:prepilin signal peptidase PulO-like enzyme (type II secretory pathway)
VRTENYTVNYVSPGALSIPRSYWYLPDHIEPFPPTRAGQWWLALLDLVTFIPAGFLIVWSRRQPVHPVPATLFAAALGVVLAAGKFLFADRHTSLANMVGQVIGGLLGALVAWRLARSRGRRPGQHPHHHDQLRDAADRGTG